MNDIFKTQTIADLTTRIQSLHANSKAQWGKMNIYEMLKHCTENERMMLRERKLKRRFIGRLIGRFILKSILKDEAPLGENTPTHADLIIVGNGDIEAQKEAWIAILKKYPSKKTSDYLDFIHPFFGKMPKEKVSIFAYKHIDHHLRQFGV